MALQTRGTCWLFTIINGFLLSDAGQKVLQYGMLRFYAGLSPAGKAYFDDGINAPCPAGSLAKTKKIYFYKFLDQYLCALSGPRSIARKAGKSAELLKNFPLRGAQARVNAGAKGAFTGEELVGVLDHLGLAEGVTWRLSRPVDRSKTPNFTVYTMGGREEFNRVPNFRPETYTLACCGITIGSGSKTGSFHSVTGYIHKGKGFIFDSNRQDHYPCDWWDYNKLRIGLTPVLNHYKNKGPYDYIAYSYVIHVNKEWADAIPLTCRLKYKNTKTPNIPGVNLTSPGLGARINKGNFYYLTPAQRVALKRRWAATKHRSTVVLNKATFNAIVKGSNSNNSAMNKLYTLQNAGYSFNVNGTNYKQFRKNIEEKFHKSPYATAKAALNRAKTPAQRRAVYSTVWRGVPLAKRKVLRNYRDTGKWN
jgi:hypothetical protein